MRGFDFLRRHWVFISLLVLFLLWSYLSFMNEGVFYNLVDIDSDYVIEFVNGFGGFAWVALVLLTIVEVIFAPLPPLILYVVGGYVFGSLLGGTLILIGNVIGAIIAFWIARKFGRRFVEKRVKQKSMKKFDRYSKKYGLFTIFILRINPLTSTDMFSYLAGLSRMSVWSMVIGTVLGLAPLIYLQSYLGEFIARGDSFFTLLFIWISIVYAAVVVYGFWYAFLRKK